MASRPSIQGSVDGVNTALARSSGTRADRYSLPSSPGCCGARSRSPCSSPLALLLHHEPGLLGGDDRDAGAGARRGARCTLIGVPVGIAAARRPRLYALLRPVLDLMQTLPTFVYLTRRSVLFGLGVVPGLISTVIFALPAPIRLTQLGISSVPSTLLEAGAGLRRDAAAAAVKDRAAERARRRSLPASRNASC